MTIRNDPGCGSLFFGRHWCNRRRLILFENLEGNELPVDKETVDRLGNIGVAKRMGSI